MKRRDFVKNSIAVGATLSTLPMWSSGCTKGSQLPKRTLGQTGEQLSIIGFGGILVRDDTPEAAAKKVADAIEAGINYFDVAPSYGDAEEKLGPALKPFRKNCFLACKTQQRDRAGAEEELHASLKQLETDHFDLYQLHALSKIEDVETVFGPDGAMETFLKAQKEGKIRFIGFSAHSEEAALLAMEKFDFDTILYPINFVCWHQGNFGPLAVAKAREKKMGILALKGLAYSKIGQGEARPYKKCWYRPIEDPGIADLGLRFTLSQGVTAAVPPGESRFLGTAIEIANNFTPITAQEKKEVKKLSEGVAPIFTA